MILVMMMGYSVSGLMVMFLWTMNACKLVEGLVFYKDEKKCTKQLIGLYVINAFYLPTLVQYSWLDTVPINGVFYVLNVIFLIYTQKNYKGKLKFPYIYLICSGLVPLLLLIIPGAEIVGIHGTKPLWITYTLLTVVLLPVSYYILIRKSPMPQAVMKHIKRRSLSYTKRQVYKVNCKSCGAVMDEDCNFCGVCGSALKGYRAHQHENK